MEKIIEKEVYPAFLTSDVFIEFIQTKEDEATTVENVNETNTLPMPAGSSGAISICSSSHTNMLGLVPNTSDGGGNGGNSATTAYNRINVDLISPFNAPNLQTLHEDSELKLNTESHSAKSRTDGRPMLTKELLLATQKGRLEVRPQG